MPVKCMAQRKWEVTLAAEDFLTSWRSPGQLAAAVGLSPAVWVREVGVAVFQAPLGA